MNHVMVFLLTAGTTFGAVVVAMFLLTWLEATLPRDDADRRYRR
jgi:hypothetical protein